MTPEEEVRLKCLELALAIVVRQVHNDPVKAVVEIATQFYNHIVTAPEAAAQSSKADKSTRNPSK